MGTVKTSVLSLKDAESIHTSGSSVMTVMRMSTTYSAARLTGFFFLSVTVVAPFT